MIIYIISSCIPIPANNITYSDYTICMPLHNKKWHAYIRKNVEPR